MPSTEHPGQPLVNDPDDGVMAHDDEYRKAGVEPGVVIEYGFTHFCINDPA